MKVKSTWLSRLLVTLNNKIWLVILWFVISPGLILGPIRLINEIQLRHNATCIKAQVIEYKTRISKGSIRGVVSFLYEYDGKYYVSNTIVNDVYPYKINEPITIIVNAKKPSQSHIWHGKEL